VIVEPPVLVGVFQDIETLALPAVAVRVSGESDNETVDTSSIGSIISGSAITLGSDVSSVEVIMSVTIMIICCIIVESVILGMSAYEFSSSVLTENDGIMVSVTRRDNCCVETESDGVMISVDNRVL